ncbi:hypothetical protein OTSKATO_1144 [Orientia tsutsugamushi str. Kato PP]|nr:hypothetical protein OTSKATO_1144 [Orientia tsutsugamushi str. Kato PP]
MQEIKLNLRPNLLRLFRHFSAIILNYLNQFRKRSIINVYQSNKPYDKSQSSNTHFFIPFSLTPLNNKR